MKFRLLLACLLLPMLAHGATAAREMKPNILFILTDDQTGSGLSFARNPLPGLRTPHLDQLAREGVMFDRCYAETPICACSRASILTGQYMRTNGIRDFSQPLTADQMAATYPALLKKRAGYFTGFLGKFGVGSQTDRDLKASSIWFDDWHVWHDQGDYFPKDDPRKRHVNEILLDEATGFFERATQSGQPFCLSISTKAPHDPWEEYESKYSSYYTEPIPIPPTLTPADFGMLPQFVRDGLSGTSAQKVREAAFQNPPDLAPYQEQASAYYRQIQGIDDLVDHLRQQLDRLGLASNTIIIFTSDNGHFVFEHGLRGKWNFYEPSAHVPLIIYDPHSGGMQVGRRNEFTLLVDMAPTMLDYAGVPIPAGMQGASLCPLVRGNDASSWRDGFFLEHTFDRDRDDIPKSIGVRQGPWKYIRWIEPRPMVESLFNIDRDPLEQRDLVNDRSQKERLAQLRVLCDQYRKQIPDRAPDYYEHPEYKVVRAGVADADKTIDFADSPVIGQSFVAEGSLLKQLTVTINGWGAELSPCGVRIRLLRGGPQGEELADRLISREDIRPAGSNSVDFSTPVREGERLFLRFETEDPVKPKQLGIFAFGKDLYAKGQAWVNGNASSSELDLQWVFK